MQGLLRMRHTIAVALLVGLAVVGLVAPVAAQPGRRAEPNRPPQNRPAERPTDDMSPAQLHQLFDAMLAMQAQNALGLNEQQYAQFLARLGGLQDARRRSQQERLRIITELQRLTNPRNPQPAADAEIAARLTVLQELESRSAGNLRRAYDAIDEVLSPLQRARFRVLEEQIERRKLELVARARQNNQKRPPPPR